MTTTNDPGSTDTWRIHLDEDKEPDGRLTRERRVSLLLYHRDGVETVPLRPGEPVLIGRGAPSTVRIADTSLSRGHALVELTEGRVTITDRGSTNGTFVNGRRIVRDNSTVVQPTDEIVLGTLRAGVHVLSPSEGALPGFCSYERFRIALEDEVLRARHYNRPFGVLMVRASGAHAMRWGGRLLSRLQPVDRASIYGPEAIEILLPERDREAVMDIAGRIAGEGEAPLLVGVALYPGLAASAEELLERSREAAQRASPAAPIAVAAAGGLGLREGSAGDNEKQPLVRSRGMKEVMDTVKRSANSPLAVLLQGETGVGKEVIAKAIHAASPRRGKSLIAVNCAAIPAQLMESTLFGHVRGAFTGAFQDHKGVFEAADGGTVLLDEVGELPLPTQAALLRVLEEKTVTRVGSTKEIPIDVRVISATNRDLDALSASGGFRPDLLFRLNAFVIRVPHLRSRVDEIEPLAMRFLRQASAASGRTITGFERGALALMEAYSWPGNVRELKNAVERAVAVAVSDTITEEDLPERVRAAASRLPPSPPPPPPPTPSLYPSPPPPLKPASASPPAPEAPPTLPAPPAKSEPAALGPAKAGEPEAPTGVEPLEVSVEREEKRRIVVALDATGNKQTRAAELLGISLRTLANKIRRYNIRRGGYTVNEPPERPPPRGTKPPRNG